MDAIDELFKGAKACMENAHAPYSKFNVGAAILDKSGRIHLGCNVENVAYPEGTCAEAGAIAAMCAAGGDRRIEKVLVIADCAPVVAPCGGCRQKIREFADGTVTIHLCDTSGVQQTTTLDALLPGSFNAAHLDAES